MITVVSLKFFFMHSCIKASVLKSTLDVASSKTRKRFFLNIALAKHSSCFSPTENNSEVFVIFSSSLLGNYDFIKNYILNFMLNSSLTDGSLQFPFTFRVERI